MTGTRAYWRIPIEDSGEPLVEIPLKDFAHSQSHAYQALGAPYGAVSPYYVRESVLEGLYVAQDALRQEHARWKLFIFDAYRPLEVQAFMANHAFQSLLQERNLSLQRLTQEQQESLWAQVYTIWAPPNRNPTTPPPHSTGGAVDITLYDLDSQSCVDMGSPIDEISARSQPHYFDQQLEDQNFPIADRLQAQMAAHNRQLLFESMACANFCRHAGEWWHFCLGDQMWVWLNQPKTEIKSAWYGRYDLVRS